MERLKFVWSLAATLGVLCTTLVINLVVKLWWRPLRTKKFFESQGIGGPPYKTFHGNTQEIIQMMNQATSTPMDLSHNIVPRVLPHIHAWTKSYGRTFLHWFGPIPRIVIPDPELIKVILSNKSGHYRKPSPSYQAWQMLGDGLVHSEAERWARQRRLISPAFHAESLKSMVPVAVRTASNMLDNWKEAVGCGSKEIEVFKEFRSLTADIISRAAFGSNYAEGKHVFGVQAEQAILAVESFKKFAIPGHRFLPTRDNWKGRKLQRQVQISLRQLILQRENAVKMGKMDNYGTDLLGLLMAANEEGMPLQDMVDECKTFYFAGHETTSILLTWTIILLAMHTEWQERARKEVLDVCDKDAPNAETLSRLKLVSMILSESLRLYPPVPAFSRQTYKTVKLGNLNIPAGTELVLPIAAVHHDPELWGKDVNEFNPQRFSEGVSKAAEHPMALMPFGLGPRICVGQNFALIESKVVVAMILQRFSFVLSPAYAHSPELVATLHPQHGAQIILHRLFNRRPQK